MKKRTAALLLCAVLTITLFTGASSGSPVVKADFDNFAALLTDLVNETEAPSAGGTEKIEADLKAIRAVSWKDHALARAVADRWRTVYLDPDYPLCLYQGGENAPELLDAGVTDSPSHAIVVLGYALKDGQMQPELMGRCDAAAAAARSLPSAILVCSGGATGSNNPDRRTEAGEMKAYLTERWGIDPGRICIDEAARTTAENAVNTFKILRERHIRTMTIVTSSYHQRRGQVLYDAVGALCRRQSGYSVEIVGNFCYEIEPSSPMLEQDVRITARQVAEILKLPEAVMDALPRMQPPETAGKP